MGSTHEQEDIRTPPSLEQPGPTNVCISSEKKQCCVHGLASLIQLRMTGFGHCEEHAHLKQDIEK